MSAQFVKAVFGAAVFAAAWGCKSDSVADVKQAPKSGNESTDKPASSDGSPKTDTPQAGTPTPGAMSKPGKITRSASSPFQNKSPQMVMNSFKRPPMPTAPRADEKVSGAYKVGGTTVEVEAICKMTEENISCWDMNGSSNEEMVKRIKESLARQQNYGLGSNISTFFGKKNRLIVTKTTQQGIFDGKTSAVMVQSAGSQVMSSGYFNLAFDNPMRAEANQPIVRYEARFAIEDAAAKATSVRLSQSDPIQEKVSIDCKLGATATFAGETYTIQSIKKGVEGGGPRIPGQENAWTIHVKRTRKAEHPVYATLVPTGPDGVVFQFADPSGNPVSLAQYQKEMQEMHSKPVTTDPQMMMRRFRPVSNGYSVSNPNEIVYMLFINPTKVAKFNLVGSNTKIVDIVGIPLDPKK